MKVAIVFSDGIKQINFTPENDDEWRALSLITPDDQIEMAVKNGSFGDKSVVPYRADISKCKGGYLRAFEGKDSVMLVLSPRSKENVPVDDIVDLDSKVDDFASKALFPENANMHYASDYVKGFREGVKKYIESGNNTTK